MVLEVRGKGTGGSTIYRQRLTMDSAEEEITKYFGSGESQEYIVLKARRVSSASGS